MKRCSRCKRWLPATTKYFYATTSRGRKLNQWGEPYLRSECRDCKKKSYREWAQRNDRRRTPEERERYRKMARARDAAYRRLAAVHEELFISLYDEELRKEGIGLKKYMGPMT